MNIERVGQRSRAELEALTLAQCAALTVWITACSADPGFSAGMEAENVQSSREAETLRALGNVADTAADVEAKRLTLPRPPRSLPTAVDLSSTTPPPSSQGTQNSSTAWAAAYAAKSHGEAAEWGWSTEPTRYQYSPSWLYNQINGGKNQSVKISTALDFLKQHGGDTLAFFPYASADFSKQPDATSFERAIRFAGAGWGTLPLDLTAFKQVLAGNDVIIAGLEVFPDFDSLSSANNVYDSVSGSSRGRQSVAIVGYDDARSAFKLMNSWGQGWGELGYGWLSYALLTDPSLALTGYKIVEKQDMPPATINLYAVQDQYLYKADREFGDWSSLNPDWLGSTSMTFCDRSLYIVQGDNLWKVDPTTGEYEPIGKTNIWAGATELACAGGKLYLMFAQKLWSINPATGKVSRIGTKTFGAPKSMVADQDRDRLYLLDDDKLYTVFVPSGEPVLLSGSGWGGPAELALVHHIPYAVQDDVLWRVNIADGTASRLGDGVFPNVTAMTGMNDFLYVISDGSLYFVTLFGKYERLGPAHAWDGTRLLTHWE